MDHAIYFIASGSLITGITGFILARVKRARFVISIQDIFPLAAVELGVLTNPRVIRFFEAMEKWVYRKADHIVVIAEGFRQNLLRKGVPEAKLSVVSNWADTDFIKPGSRENGFRNELNVGSRFTLVYSGGLTLNSNVEPMIGAAESEGQEAAQEERAGSGHLVALTENGDGSIFRGSRGK